MDSDKRSLGGTSMSSHELKDMDFAPSPDGINRIDRPGSNTEAEMQPQVQTRSEAADEEKATASGGKPELPPFHPMNNPDGGRQAWLTVVGAWCCLFVSFGWISSIGVFQAYYETHQLRTYSPSSVAWIPSLEAFMMFSGGPIIGKIFDNYGVQPLLLVGSFFHVFGLMMTSLGKEYYQFLLAQGICSPLGASMIFYPAMGTISTWFFKKRALAFGIAASGSSIGGIILPIMVQRMLPEVGFGWTMRTAAFLILFLQIISNLTVTSRIPPVKRPLTIMEFITPLKEVPFTLTAFGCFLFFLGMFLPINYIIVQAQQAGMSAYLASYLVAILNAVSFFGRIIPGWAADHLGRYNIILVMCVFTATIDLALWIPAKSNAPIIVFAALYGFGSGTFVSMAPALIAQISPDVSKIGVRTGSLFAIISTAALIGNPIGGRLVTDWDGEFTGLQIFCGCMLWGGTLFILAARFAIVGFKLKVKV